MQITKQAVSHSMHVEDEKTHLVLPVELCGHIFFSFMHPSFMYNVTVVPWDVSRRITSEVLGTLEPAGCNCNRCSTWADKNTYI